MYFDKPWSGRIVYSCKWYAKRGKTVSFVLGSVHEYGKSTRRPIDCQRCQPFWIYMIYGCRTMYGGKAERARLLISFTLNREKKVCFA